MSRSGAVKELNQLAWADDWTPANFPPLAARTQPATRTLHARHPAPKGSLAGGLM